MISNFTRACLRSQNSKHIVELQARKFDSYEEVA